MALTYMHVDGAGAGDYSGSTWANAMSFASFYTGETNSFDAVAAGYIYFFMGGQTYSLTSNISTAIDGTAADRIAIIGVASGTTNEGAAIDDADFAQGSDRPIFDGNTAYYIDLADYSGVENCIAESGLYPILLAAACIVKNCKVNTDYTGATTRTLINCVSSYLKVINCELFSDEAGTGLVYGVQGNIFCLIAFCYVHDMTTGSGSTGITPYGTIPSVLFCIFDNLDKTVTVTSDESGIFFGCTFYDCDDALPLTDGTAASVINCIFSDCTTSAISSTASTFSHLLMYNHFYNNGDNHLNVPEEGDAADLFCDWWATTGDPKFTTAGSDFSLQSDSPCIDAGMAMALGVG